MQPPEDLLHEPLSYTHSDRYPQINEIGVMDEPSTSAGSAAPTSASQVLPMQIPISEGEPALRLPPIVANPFARQPSLPVDSEAAIGVNNVVVDHDGSYTGMNDLNQFAGAEDTLMGDSLESLQSPVGAPDENIISTLASSLSSSLSSESYPDSPVLPGESLYRPEVPLYNRLNKFGQVEFEAASLAPNGIKNPTMGHSISLPPSAEAFSEDPPLPSERFYRPKLPPDGPPATSPPPPPLTIQPINKGSYQSGTGVVGIGIPNYLNSRNDYMEGTQRVEPPITALSGPLSHHFPQSYESSLPQNPQNYASPHYYSTSLSNSFDAGYPLLATTGIGLPLLQQGGSQSDLPSKGRAGGLLDTNGGLLDAAGGGLLKNPNAVPVGSLVGSLSSLGNVASVGAGSGLASGIGAALADPATIAAVNSAMTGDRMASVIDSIGRFAALQGDAGGAFRGDAPGSSGGGGGMLNRGSGRGRGDGEGAVNEYTSMLMDGEGGLRLSDDGTGVVQRDSTSTVGNGNGAFSGFFTQQQQQPANGAAPNRRYPSNPEGPLYLSDFGINSPIKFNEGIEAVKKPALPSQVLSSIISPPAAYEKNQEQTVEGTTTATSMRPTVAKTKINGAGGLYGDMEYPSRPEGAQSQVLRGSGGGHESVTQQIEVENAATKPKPVIKRDTALDKHIQSRLRKEAPRGGIDDSGLDENRQQKVDGETTGEHDAEISSVLPPPRSYAKQLPREKESTEVDVNEQSRSSASLGERDGLRGRRDEKRHDETSALPTSTSRRPPAVSITKGASSSDEPEEVKLSESLISASMKTSPETARKPSSEVQWSLNDAVREAPSEASGSSMGHQHQRGGLIARVGNRKQGEPDNTDLMQAQPPLSLWPRLEVTEDQLHESLVEDHIMRREKEATAQSTKKTVDFQGMGSTEKESVVTPYNKNSFRPPASKTKEYSLTTEPPFDSKDSDEFRPSYSLSSLRVSAPPPMYSDPARDTSSAGSRPPAATGVLTPYGVLPSSRYSKRFSQPTPFPTTIAPAADVLPSNRVLPSSRYSKLYGRPPLRPITLAPPKAIDEPIETRSVVDICTAGFAASNSPFSSVLRQVDGYPTWAKKKEATSIRPQTQGNDMLWGGGISGPVYCTDGRQDQNQKI
eukprot:GHVN01073961.1.p1 GENE.GHVN01073961.1~~GHVN01073961.1.p1  ORF type:complete len:1256 (-),score=196.48 GHVN01073961.1:2735-6151(-)